MDKNLVIFCLLLHSLVVAGWTSDKFAPETVHLADFQTVQTLLDPMTETVCSIKCFAMPSDACNSIIWSGPPSSNCTLGLVPAIYDPFKDGSDVLAKVKYDTIRGPRCHSGKPCGLGGGVCFADIDCRAGLVCTNGICEVCGIEGKTMSTVFADDDILYGPEKAMEGYAVSYDGAQVTAYTSVTKNHEINPWWQVEFSCQIEVEMVLLVNNPTDDNWNNYGLYVSNTAAVTGSLPAPDTLCGTVTGPSWNGRIHEMICTQILAGKYVIFQVRNTAVDYLQLNEIIIFGPNSGRSIEDRASAMTFSSVNIAPNVQAVHATDNKLGHLEITGTNHEDYPWLQFEFDEPFPIIERFIVFNRGDCCAEWFVDIGFHVGSNPAVYAQETNNPSCGAYSGAILGNYIFHMKCLPPRQGKYAIIQKHTAPSAVYNDLSFLEVVIIGHF